jgi:hypothetical protein
MIASARRLSRAGRTAVQKLGVKAFGGGHAFRYARRSDSSCRLQHPERRESSMEAPLREKRSIGTPRPESRVRQARRALGVSRSLAALISRVDAPAALPQ